MATCALRFPNANMNFTSTFLGDFWTPKRPFSQIKTNNGGKQSAVAPYAIAFAMKKVAITSPLNLNRVWKEIQGLNNWENLVEPLNSLLRDEIIRYGEFIVACYKAFDLDPNSKRYLNCKYGKSNLLKEVGLGQSGYEVTKYIYATPEINFPMQKIISCCGRWIGYVAVSTDEESLKLGRRDVVVSFRGTITNQEWLANLMSGLTPAHLDPHDPRPDVKVEAGFLTLYTSNERNCKFGLPSCRQQLLSEVSRVLNMYQGEEMSITIAGHSMGSSLAHLLAYDISELGLNCKDVINNDCVPVTVFSFGGPRVGNVGFKQRCEELGVKVLRIVNVKDPITKLPGVLFNEGFKVLAEIYDLPWSCSCYAHVGVELLLDFFKIHNPSCVHDLETYINLIKSPPKNLLVIQREELKFPHKVKKLSLSASNIKALVSGTNGVLTSNPSFVHHFLSHILIF